MLGEPSERAYAQRTHGARVARVRLPLPLMRATYSVGGPESRLATRERSGSLSSHDSRLNLGARSLQTILALR